MACSLRTRKAGRLQVQGQSGEKVGEGGGRKRREEKGREGERKEAEERKKEEEKEEAPSCFSPFLALLS